MPIEEFRGGGGRSGGRSGGSRGSRGGSRGRSGRSGRYSRGRGRNWRGRGWNNYWGGGGWGNYYYYPWSYDYYDPIYYTTGYDVINVVDNTNSQPSSQSCNRLEDKGQVYFCPANAAGFSKQGENWMCVCPNNQFIPTSSTCSDGIQRCM